MSTPKTLRRRLLASKKKRRPVPSTQRRPHIESLERRDLFALASPPTDLFETATAPVAVQLGLFDDDGRTDMAILEANGDLSIALNNGDDTWQQIKTSNLAISGASGLAFGLINGDAYLDAIVQGANEVVIAYGDGSGTFTRAQSLAPGATGQLVTSGFSNITPLPTLLNGDTLTDLVVAIPGSDQIAVYLGQASGVFGSPTKVTSGGDRPVRIVAGDFLAGSSPDLAVAHGDGTLTFLEGDATGNFTLRTSSTVSGLGTITGLATGDFNEDQQTDIVVSSTNNVRVLLNPSDSLPVSPLSNGDFELGLTNWTSTAGSVSALSGIAQLRESGTELLTTLERTFLIPAGATSLSFDLVALGLESPTNGLADAFEVSLLNAADQSLVPTFRTEATSFLNASPDGTVRLASGVTRVGNRITLNLTGLTPGTAARLVFDLVGSPSGTGSTVSIDNVTIDPAQAWGTTFTSSGLSGTFTSTAGLAVADVDLDGHLDILVSDNVEERLVVAHGNGSAGFTNWTYDTSSYGTGAGSLAVAPLTNSDLTPDVIVVIPGVSSVLSPLEYEPIVESEIFRVPGAPGELTELVFTWDVRDAGYNNELGFFIVDDYQGRVNGLLPGASGYIEAALASAGRQVVFASNQTQGAVTRVVLPAGTRITPYLIQNNTTGQLIRNNPTGSVSGSPLVWFLHGAANTDGYNHFQVTLLPDGRVQYNVEDQTHSGDGDFNDMIFTLHAEPGEPLPLTRFTVVDDTSVANFRYNQDGLPAQQTGLAPTNTRPRDITTVAAGDKYWVIDANKKIYVYDADGEMLGSWQPTGLNTPTGIATDGTDIWIVDSGTDRVHRYTGAASRLSGSQAAIGTFNLSSGNGTASGITTDGSKLWVSDEGSDKVFVYSFQGQLLGSWQLDSANSDASGLTVNPAGGNDLWVVDRQDQKVYHYAGGELWTSGQHNATSTFNLAAANRKPEGIADPPTAISLDATVTGTISTANQINEYTFTVTAGQRIYFEMISLTGVSASYVTKKLFDPSSTQITNGFGIIFANNDTIELTSSGTYTLQIKSSIAGANYSFKIIDVPDTIVEPITLDVNESGTLSKGETREFTFAATAGQMVYLDAISPTNVSNGMFWKLIGPTSNTVISNRGYADVDTVTLADTGTYTLQVYGTTDNRTYEFKVVDVPATSSTSISLDTLVTAQITKMGETDEFTFEGTIGQRLYLYSITPTSVLSEIYWTLRSPTNAVTISNRGLAGDVDTFTLTESGTYTLRVHGMTAALDYSFKVIDVPPIVTTPIVFDTTYNDSIAVPGATNRYTFNGEAGQRLYFDLSSGLGKDWKLTGPAGTVFNWTGGDVEQVLAQTGLYTLDIDASEASLPSYSFKVFNVPAPSTTPIDFGEVIDGTITVPGEFHRFTFTATAGQQALFDAQIGNSGQFIWRLYSPTGTQVFTNTQYVDKGPLTLVAGTYTLEVDGLNASTVAYRFRVADVAPAVVDYIEIGDTVSDSVASSGEVHQYRFNAAAGQLLYVNALTGSAGSLQMKLEGPAGSIWTSSFADVDTFAVGQTGEYVLTVNGVGAATGAFSFTLVGVPALAPQGISYGQTVQGTIGVPGEEDHYTFSGQAGDRLYLDVLNNPGLYIRGIELRRSNGTSVFVSPVVSGEDRTLFTLPATDTYTIIVGELSLPDTTGDYRFRLVSVPANLTLPATWNVDHSDFIVPGQTVEYTFHALAGQGLLLDLIANGGAVPFTLLGPSSQTIFSSQATDRWVDSLPATGTYTLILGDATNDKSGPIKFRIQDIATPELGLPDTMGTDFWIAFPSMGRDLQNAAETSEQAVYITSHVNTTGTVSIPGLNWFTSYSVVAGQTTRVALPAGAEISLSSAEVTSERGVRVTALDEVAVQATSFLPALSDGYQALPVDALGQEYLAMTYKNTGLGFNQYLNSSHFVVVATVDNTTVTITPTDDAGSRTPGVSYTISLDAGEIYQLTHQQNPGDLTGSHITADHPIAVLSGNGGAIVPANTPTSNILLEQLAPLETWGREFVTIPFATRQNGDLFRILAGHDDTSVSINGVVVATLDKGQFYETVLSAAAHITADQGILVAQISHSTNYDYVLNADPFMLIVPPAEQHQTQHVITTPTVGYLSHYLNIVVPTHAQDSILLDGVALAGVSFTALGATGFSTAQILISPGRHEITSPAALGVTMYGYGVQDGYGYTGSFHLAPLSEISSLGLTPLTANVPLGSQHLVVATVRDASNNPIPGVRVDFVTSGSIAAFGSAVTNAAGQAQFSVTGSTITTDTITARVNGLTANATVTWSDSAPVISVESPTPDSELVVSDSYLLTGLALPGTPLGSIVDVKVNGFSVEALDAKGRFFIRVPIALGTNTFSITATRADGITSTISVDYEGIAAPGGGIDLDLLTDVTGVATLTSRNTFFNRSTRKLYTEALLRNTGNVAMTGPVVALVDRITPGSVTLLSPPDGAVTDGRLQVIFDSEFGGNALAAGASTTTGTWLEFVNPTRARFAIDATLLVHGNSAPTVESVPRLEAVPEVAYTYQIQADDIDNDALSYELTIAPTGMTVDNNGQVLWEPLTTQVGSNDVEVVVRDQRGGEARQRFTVNVRLNPVNRAPIFTTAPVAEAAVSSNYLYEPGALDLEGDVLTWSLDTKPTGMGIDPDSGEITWAGATTGNHPITIRVEDGEGGVAFQSFVLSVGSPSPNLGAPLLRNTPPTVGTVDVLYAWQAWADDPEGGTLSYSLSQKPTGMSIDAGGRITWTPQSGQAGPNTVELVIDDNAGGITSLIFAINVADPAANVPPVFTSLPVFVGTVGVQYLYQFVARDADGDSISFELVAAPDGMVLDEANRTLTWTPTAVGEQLVRLRVYDGNGGVNWQNFLIDVRPVNSAPQFTTSPITSATAGVVYRYDAAAFDADDAVTFSLLDAPTNARIDPHSGLIWWLPAGGDVGPHSLAVVATDQRGASTVQSFTLTVGNDTEAPLVTLVRSAEVTSVSTPVDLQVFASDNLGVSTYALTVNGTPLTLDSNHATSYTPLTPGFYTFVASATDADNNTGTRTFRLRVVDPSDTTAPTVTLTSPSANATVSYLTDLLGTINDAQLDYWRVEYARFDTSEFRTLAQGNSNIASSLIATFDPTMLQNDQYVVHIIAGDVSGNTTTLELPLEVFGQAKLGQFRQEFTDLTIPLAGIPITITRVYDTLQANEVGDFGYGWTLGVREARIRETVRQDPLEPLVGLFATNAFREGTRVYLNAPDGRRIGFTFTPEVEEGGWLGEVWRPKFTADPGVYETLSVPDMPLSKYPDDTYHLYWSGFNYNPSEYSLTTRDGTVYSYDQFTGLKSVTDRNSNTLTYTPAGIFSSTGESIEFVRDAQGRITEIVDPAGNSLTYTYSPQGDLILFQNQENLGTSYNYYSDPAHYLREVTSDCGCTSYLRTEYDDAGRIIAVYDANGVPANMEYDLENNSEVIGDREGNETILVYDDRGNITSVTDAMGATTSYTYDAQNNQTSITDGRGFTTTQTYDTHGNVTSITDPYNKVWGFTYTAHNDVSTVIDPLDRVQTFVYDANGNLEQFTDADGQSINIEVDAQGRTLEYTDRTGKTTTFQYGLGSQPTRITNADLTYRELEYNAIGLPIELTDEEGRVTVLNYDKSGRPTSILDAADGLVTMAYDDQHLTQVTDQLNRVTRYEYDDAGRRTRVVDALGGVTRYTYDGNGQVTSVTDALNNTTSYVYRADGLLGSVVDALGGTTTYQYDDAKNVIGILNTNGHLTAYEYDKRNRVARETNQLGGYRQFTYDAVGNLKSAHDENGRVTSYNYDLLDRLVERVNALSGVAEWTYDNEGFVLTATDEANHTTTYGYDNRHRLTTITDPANKVQSYVYDNVGNQISYTDEMLRTTTYDYDDLNRLIEVTEPLSAITTYSYDAVGNVLTMTDPLLRTTEYEYDDLNRLTKSTDPRNAETRYTYDALGNLKSLTDPVNNQTRYNYDPLSRLTEEIDPLGRSTTMTYDAVGNLHSRKDRNGRVVEYSYDELERLTAERWLSSGSLLRTLSFEYDAAGNLLSAADPDSSYTYTYDALHRVSTIDNNGTPDAPRVILTAGYDAAGRRTSISDDDGVAVTSTYNSRGLLEARTWQGGGIDPARVEYSYNNAGQRTELERFADATGTTRIGRTTYGYDTQGRRNDIVHRDAIDDILVDYDYVLDLADQLTSEAHHGQTATYTHDDAGQLTDADHSSLSDEEYSYDLNGNRTLSGYVIGAGNRVLSDGTFDYAYDGEGNLLTKTEIATGTVTSFNYDHRNRLVAVEVRNSASTLLQSVEYVYDVFDRRIAKSVDADGAGVAVAVTTHFVYDGEHVWADYDGTGVVLARYLFGDRTDEILARYRPGEGTAWYLTDHLGTVRDQVDDTGDVINHLDYDSFGNIVAQSNAVVGDRYTYTGREFDIETGLFYYRARYYDAHLGRFISQDPISFSAGDANLYRYVGNEVISSTDPSGLMSLTEYGKKLWAGPVGTLLRNAQFQCFAWTLGGYGIGKGLTKTITGEFGSVKAQEVGSLALGGISCTMFPTSASAQATFLALTEIFYLHAIGASATDIALAGVMHTFGVAGGNGSLSQYAGQVWGGIRRRIPEFILSESGQGNPLLGVPELLANIIRSLPGVKKAVNSGIAHAAEQAVNKGLAATKEEVIDELRELSKSITSHGFPAGTLPDPGNQIARADSVLVPFRSGAAVYEVGKNGTAKLQTLLSSQEFTTARQKLGL